MVGQFHMIFIYPLAGEAYPDRPLIGKLDGIIGQIDQYLSDTHRITDKSVRQFALYQCKKLNRLFAHPHIQYVGYIGEFFKRTVGILYDLHLAGFDL